MKKFIRDSILNIVATLVVTISLQIIILPLASKYESDIEFGNIISILAIINSLSALIGSSLNNLRLINSELYSNKKGDFGYLLLVSLVIGSIIFSFALFNYVVFLDHIIYLLVFILMTFRIYLIVYFRINLNFSSILIHSLILSIGYVVGSIIYIVTKNFPLILLSGEIFSMLFLYFKLNLRALTIKKTSNFNKIRSDYINLSFSNLANVFSMYLDRYLILFMMGGKYVGYYFIASVLGKLMATISIPISGVILAYLNSSKLENQIKLFKKMVILSISFGVFIYILLYIVSPYIITILYPSNWNNVKEYYNLANIGVILYLIGTFINTYCIKYLKMNRQLMIQYIYVFILVLLGLFLIKEFGLKGFIVATIIANTIRIIIICMIAYFDFYKNILRGSKNEK